MASALTGDDVENPGCMPTAGGDDVGATEMAENAFGSDGML